MIYVVIRSYCITSGVYVLIQFFIFCHPEEAGELVDMTGLPDLIVDRICRIIPVYIYIDFFGRMKLRSEQIIIDCSSDNGAQKEGSDQNG